MKKAAVLAVVFFGVCAVTSLDAAGAGTAGKGTVSAGRTEMKMPKMESALELRLAMRMLWEDHIAWTRSYIISSISNLEDINKVSERLLKNQDDIGNAIKPYYGEEAGNKLASLLKAHINIATEVINAAKLGITDDLTAAQNKWKANAGDIAAFLSAANPNWKKNDLSDMLYKHLDLTTGEVTSRLNKDWASDISSYDKGQVHMLKFADVLTSGIIKQFPSKFKK